tara:strand:- start:233 stop:1318 length:1086 start_codon:yes stop_codon:yes gene_type:complete
MSGTCQTIQSTCSNKFSCTSTAGSGILQIVARGSQDQYLTGDSRDIAEASSLFACSFYQNLALAFEDVLTQIEYRANFPVIVSTPRSGDILTDAHLVSYMPPLQAEEAGENHFGNSFTVNGSESVNDILSFLTPEEVMQLLGAIEASDKEAEGGTHDDLLAALQSLLETDGEITGDLAEKVMTAAKKTSALGISTKTQLVSALQNIISAVEVGSSEPQAIYTDAAAMFMIDAVLLKIGASQIDHHTGLSIFMLSEFMGQAGLERWEVESQYMGDLTTALAMASQGQYWCVQLPFYFTQSLGLGLPLIALQYHDVQISIKFQPLNRIVKVINGSPSKSYVVTVGPGDCAESDPRGAVQSGVQ